MVVGFSHKLIDFSIEAFPLDTGGWGCAIFPKVGVGRGLVICEPDATKNSGRPVRFDDEQAAVQGGKDYIQQDLLRA